jgi:hypothetical protein
MGANQNGKGIAVYVSFPNSMPWDEQCRALNELRKHPQVSRIWSHQVANNGNKRYSKVDYPDCNTVIGQADLHIVVEARGGDIGKGSATEIIHSISCNRPVWLCDDQEGFIKYQDADIYKSENYFPEWWVNESQCTVSFTDVMRDVCKEKQESYKISSSSTPAFTVTAETKNNENYYY